MSIKVITVPSASETYKEVISTALTKALNKIKEATENGETHCYIASNSGKTPVEVIETLLDAGYNISYKKFYMGEWFIKAYWEECKERNGKLFRENDCSSFLEDSIENYKLA